MEKRKPLQPGIARGNAGEHDYLAVSECPFFKDKPHRSNCKSQTSQ